MITLRLRLRYISPQAPRKVSASETDHSATKASQDLSEAMDPKPTVELNAFRNSSDKQLRQSDHLP